MLKYSIRKDGLHYPIVISFREILNTHYRDKIIKNLRYQINSIKYFDSIDGDFIGIIRKIVFEFQRLISLGYDSKLSGIILKNIVVLIDLDD